MDRPSQERVCPSKHSRVNRRLLVQRGWQVPGQPSMAAHSPCSVMHDPSSEISHFLYPRQFFSASSDRWRIRDERGSRHLHCSLGFTNQVDHLCSTSLSQHTCTQVWWVRFNKVETGVQRCRCPEQPHVPGVTSFGQLFCKTWLCCRLL